jgi:predicted amidohydrolase
VGRCGDLEFNGGTAVYDPQGRAVDRVESGEGMVVVDLDLETVTEARRINPYERDRVDDSAGRVVLTLG